MWDDIDRLNQRLKRYHVTQLLNIEPLGIWYLAQDKELKRNVRLCISTESADTNNSAREKFLSTVQLLVKLRANNIPMIAQVYERGDVEGYPFVAIETGPTLADWLTSNQAEKMQPKPEMMLGLVKKLVETLHKAHQYGVVFHRLRPQNIILRDFNSPLLAELNIISTADEPTANAQSVMYDLGTILYTSLTRHSIDDTVQDDNEIKALPGFQPTKITPMAINIVNGCLDTHPNKRFDSLEKLLQALHEALLFETSQSRAVIRGKRLWQWLAGGVFIGFALLLIWQVVKNPVSQKPIADPRIVPTLTQELHPSPSSPITSPVANHTPTLIRPTVLPTRSPEPPTATVTPTESPVPSATKPVPLIIPIPLIASPTEFVPTLVITRTCFINPIERWANLYRDYQASLDCPITDVMYPEAAYQFYPGGLMFWRADRNIVYVLYTVDHTFVVYDAGLAQAGFYDNENLKGAFGWLWHNQPTIQERLGIPTTNEANPTDFSIQDFVNGSIFSFREGGDDNNYLLIHLQSQWLTSRS